MKRQIDRFTLGSALGAGGSSSVFQAEETLPGNVRRPVALKLLPPLAAGDKAGREKFFAQIKALVALAGHPHIVTIYSIGLADDETPWLAMELLPQALTSLLADAPAAPADVQRMLEHTLVALNFMHTRETPLLHNDLKPANILLDAFGNFKLAGLERMGPPTIEPTLDQGAVRYAAPELLSREFGKICPATDLYALGHVAYEMALGARLYRSQFPAVFDAKTSSRDVPPAKWMQWHCSIPTALAPVHQVVKTFPHALSAVIAKLTGKALEDRYAAAADALNDLRNAAAPAAPPAPAPSPALSPPAGTPIPLAPTVPSATPLRRAPATPSAPSIPAPAAPQQAPVASGAHYYVRLRGRTSGPFDLPTLQRHVRQGALSRLHQVSTDQVTWQPVTAVPELFHA